MGSLRCRRAHVDPQLAGTLISPRLAVRGRGYPRGCPGLFVGRCGTLCWSGFGVLSLHPNKAGCRRFTGTPPMTMTRELRAFPPQCRGADSAGHGSEHQHIAGESTGLGELRCRLRRHRWRSCRRCRCRCRCRRRRRTGLEGQSRHVGMCLAGRELQGVLHERSFIPSGRRASHGERPSGGKRGVCRGTCGRWGIKYCSRNRARLGRFDSVVVVHRRRACG